MADPPRRQTLQKDVFVKNGGFNDGSPQNSANPVRRQDRVVELGSTLYASQIATL